MAKWILAAGAAALALSSPALAQDKGKGGDKGGAKAERGGGGNKAERGNGGGQKDRQARTERGNDKRQAQRVDRREDRDMKPERQAQRIDRGNGNAKKVERQVARSERADKIGKSERRGDKVETRTVSRDFDRRLRSDNDARRSIAFNDGRGSRGVYDNCPPGLARKGNGCLPPGQAKKMIGAALPVARGSQFLDGPYRQWYRDNDQYTYREDGDYIYRVNRQGGLIDALFPYQDRDYSYYDVGSAYPSDYDYYNVPQQYQSYYADGDDYTYRYGDGAIYQVDRSDNMISSIVALLAGDLAVGQQMPDNYAVYNVPVAYRDRYYDTAEAQYRYNDGYIYRADPKTQLITAVIDALV